MISTEISKGVYQVITGREVNVYIFKTSIGAALIDAGGDRKAADVLSALDELELSPYDVRLILLTHGHEGHAHGARVFAGAEVRLHEGDIGLAEPRGGILDVITKPFKRDDPVPAFRPLRGYEFIPFGERNFLALHTPGHTKGSVCYLSGDLLFTGDTLLNDKGFRIGHADGSSYPSESLILSARRLRDYLFYFICPGHGGVIKDGKIELYRLLEGISLSEAR